MAAVNFQTEVDIVLNVLKWRTDLVVSMADYYNYSFQVRCGEAQKKLTVAQFLGDTVFCVSVRLIQKDVEFKYVASDIATAFVELPALLSDYPDLQESVMADFRNLNAHFNREATKELEVATTAEGMWATCADVELRTGATLWGSLAALMSKFGLHKHPDLQFAVYSVDEAGLPDVTIEFTPGAGLPWSVTSRGKVLCADSSFYRAFSSYIRYQKIDGIGIMCATDAYTVINSKEYKEFMRYADTGNMPPETAKEAVVLASDGSQVALLSPSDWEVYEKSNSYTLEDCAICYVNTPDDGAEPKELKIPEGYYVSKIYAI